MKRIFSLIFAMLLVLTACGGTTTMENTYQQITQQEAKVMMDTQDVIILDVREQYLRKRLIPTAWQVSEKICVSWAYSPAR